MDCPGAKTGRYVVSDKAPPVPYSVIPADIGGEAILNPPVIVGYGSVFGFLVPISNDPRPWCPEHGLMAQGAASWYCEDCWGREP